MSIQGPHRSWCSSFGGSCWAEDMSERCHWLLPTAGSHSALPQMLHGAACGTVFSLEEWVVVTAACSLRPFQRLVSVSFSSACVVWRLAACDVGTTTRTLAQRVDGSYGDLHMRARIIKRWGHGDGVQGTELCCRSLEVACSDNCVLYCSQ